MGGSKTDAWRQQRSLLLFCRLSPLSHHWTQQVPRQPIHSNPNLLPCRTPQHGTCNLSPYHPPRHQARPHQNHWAHWAGPALNASRCLLSHGHGGFAVRMWRGPYVIVGTPHLVLTGSPSKLGGRWVRWVFPSSMLLLPVWKGSMLSGCSSKLTRIAQMTARTSTTTTLWFASLRKAHLPPRMARRLTPPTIPAH